MRVVVRDARRLSPAAQEDLRRRAVAAVEAGFTQAAVSTVLGVSPQAVSRWVNAFAGKGNQALRAGKRGRRPGEQKALDPRQEARLRRAVIGKYPDQVALPGMVWTRPQVRDLVRRWFGIGLSLVTIGKYLRSWGLSPQKPIRRAYKQNPEAVARWLEQEYPAIAAQAKKDKAITGRPDPGGGQDRQTVRGERDGRDQQQGRAVLHVLHRLVHRPGVPGLARPARPPPGPEDPPHRDGHPVHRRVNVRNWLDEHVDQIQMHFLPGYSPELNPVELLNHDIKHHVAQANPANPAELAAAAASHLRRRQNQPEAVKALFGKPEVRYAAG